MLPADIEGIVEALDATARDAKALVDPLSDDQVNWQAQPGAEWSVGQCLDHLARTNRVYLQAIEASLDAARREGRFRASAVAPGFFSRAFLRSLEPPPKRKSKTFASALPRSAIGKDEALNAFLASHGDVRQTLVASADLDLQTIRFVNPFVPALRFTAGTGFLIIAAHNRRHIWQARQVLAAPGFPAS